MDDLVVKIIDNNNENNEGKCLRIKICQMPTERSIDEAIECFDDNYDNFDCPSTITAFYRKDPQSFFVAIDLDSGKIIGVCGSPLITHQTHFIGLYGVRRQYRSIGIGSLLFEKCMTSIDNEMNIGLYAVPDMLQKYMTKYDFRLKEMVSMVTFVGKPSFHSPVSHKKLYGSLNNVNFEIIQIKNLENLNKYHRRIIEYDKKIFNESRAELLKFIFHNSSYRCWCLIIHHHNNNNNDDDSTIQGYGCIRQHSKTKRLYLGPVYADNSDAAEVLIENLFEMESESIDSYGLVWNAIDTNEYSLCLASKYGLDEHERCERIFTKFSLSNQIDYRSIYAVFSPDFSI